MNEREYRRLRQKIEEEYRRKLEALDLVWSIVETSTSGRGVNEAGPAPRGAIDALVRKAVVRLPGEFGPREVRAAVEELESVPAGQVNRTTVSAALKRLEDEGIVTVVEEGRGRRPTRYRRSTQRVSANPQSFTDEQGPKTESTEGSSSDLTDDDIPF